MTGPAQAQQPPTPPAPLLALIGLGQQARAAGSVSELGFLLVNDSRVLSPYRQALLWAADRGLSHLSGVIAPEPNSPFALWARRLCEHLSAQPDLALRTLGAADLPPHLQDGWRQWMPQQGWWLPLNFGSAAAGLLVADDALDDARLPLWQEWCAVWSLAADRLAQRERQGWSGLLRRWAARQPAGAADGAGVRRWWQRRGLWAAAALAAAGALPVPLTVVGQGELVPREPVIVRAPLEGVIHEFHVAPNQQVAAGAPLFSYDDAALQSRLQVARQGLAAAQAEYRQAAQSALTDARAKFQLAGLVGRVQEKQAEVAYLAEQAGRGTVTAPQAGIALFDSVAEWIGKPVQTGERVVRLADPADVELEIWVSLADAVPLHAGDAARLFLTANPLETLHARLRWLGYEAQPRPDGSFAYRLRATLDDKPADAGAPLRVGAKGTVRLSAGRVPLVYWLLRKPLAVVRGYLLI